MNVEKFNSYRLLGVHRDSSDKQIKEAYYRQAGDLHPDRVGGDAEKFMTLAAAYRDIKSAGQRAALAELMAFAALACGKCSARGYVKTRSKAGTELLACADCGGCGYVPKQVRA